MVNLDYHVLFFCLWCRKCKSPLVILQLRVTQVSFNTSRKWAFQTLCVTGWGTWILILLLPLDKVSLLMPSLVQELRKPDNFKHSLKRRATDCQFKFFWNSDEKKSLQTVNSFRTMTIKRNDIWNFADLVSSSCLCMLTAYCVC